MTLASTARCSFFFSLLFIYVSHAVVDFTQVLAQLALTLCIHPIVKSSQDSDNSMLIVGSVAAAVGLVFGRWLLVSFGLVLMAHFVWWCFGVRVCFSPPLLGYAFLNLIENHMVVITVIIYGTGKCADFVHYGCQQCAQLNNIFVLNLSV